MNTPLRCLLPLLFFGEAFCFSSLKEALRKAGSARAEPVYSLPPKKWVDAGPHSLTTSVFDNELRKPLFYWANTRSKELNLIVREDPDALSLEDIGKERDGYAEEVLQLQDKMWDKKEALTEEKFDIGYTLVQYISDRLKGVAEKNKRHFESIQQALTDAGELLREAQEPLDKLQSVTRSKYFRTVIWSAGKYIRAAGTGSKTEIMKWYNSSYSLLSKHDETTSKLKEAVQELKSSGEVMWMESRLLTVDRELDELACVIDEKTKTRPKYDKECTRRSAGRQDQIGYTPSSPQPPSPSVDVCNALPSMTDLQPDDKWCNGVTPLSKCGDYYRTGVSGHVYACQLRVSPTATKCVADWNEPILCCDHFCDKLADKKEVNPGSPGGGPYCGASPARLADKDTCQSAYWTGGDGRAYLCVYNPNPLPGKKKCRLARGEACAC